ncbi:unnamed protein product [Tuber aestivum]|uniref:Golgi apparatus membrane protein TVP23 n=1 Tax=Tuber aestivum TaxID=59557 RepID=A0A292PWB2_9PEZI|nr:unnamed protein product [Tuber aestivum]
MDLRLKMSKVSSTNRAASQTRSLPALLQHNDYISTKTWTLVLIFIIVILLLAADFYYCKNIAGRRLVGLRWWNETNPETGEQTWVFESPDETRQINATDSRSFWLTIYVVPLLWVFLAIIAIVRFEFIWLSLVVIAIILCVTNGVAFSRADKFGNASSFAGSALNSSGGGAVRRFAGNMATRMFFSGGR